MGKNLILALVAAVAAGCAKKPGGFTRTGKDSLQKPGLLVFGVQKEKLQTYLEENGLSARELGQGDRIFDLEPTNVQALQASFPEAEIFEDAVIQLPGETDPRLIVELTPEEAQKTAHAQMATIRLTEAHSHSQGEGVVVAVIDSGINVNRFDVKDSVWKNTKEIANNNKDDDDNGYVDDVNGYNFVDGNNKLLDAIAHGTMSAALIASPVTGVAPKAKVIGLRVTNDQGSGTYAHMVEAILYARKQQVDLINLSMGARFVNSAMQKAIENLMQDDILLIQSAGNEAATCEEYPSLPAVFDLPKVMTVAALNLAPADLELAFYSNYGECVHIAAPSGESAMHPIPLQRGIVAANPYSETNYYLYHGTSAAAPVVTGVAALVKSTNPGLSATRLKQLLMDTVTQHESLKGKVNSGAINALSAVMTAKE